MAIKVVTVKCPECGASLPVEENRKQIFCEYCGAKILLENDHEYIYRHIDEAEVKRAETERMLAEEKLKREKEEREAEEIAAEQKAAQRRAQILKIQEDRRNTANGALLFIVSGISIAAIAYFLFNSSVGTLIGIVIAALGFLALKGLNESIEHEGKIPIPSSIIDIQSKNYTSIQTIFESAGFTNVRCVAMNDLTIGLLKRPGLVESITVAGESITSGGGWYPPNSPVVITYHSLSGRQ